MQIPIEDVVVKKRVREDLGDLSKLMESMRTYGLLNPIVINSSHELIAGERRLESARRLGWKTIEAHIVDRDSQVDQLEMELDENIHRRNLTAMELASAYSKLEHLKNPGFFRRIFNAVTGFFRKIFSVFKRKR
ncbi:MAG: ParB/RepB/Spo0J family partition protein [Spirochaetaceae bacterium]